MDPKVKGKFVTSLKSFLKKMEMMNKNYHKKYFFDHLYHDTLKIYGAPKLCTVI
jgi:hypothetical protein